MKELSRSQYLYLKSKKNAVLKNEIIEIDDEEYDDLIQYYNKAISIAYKNELFERIEELENIIEAMQSEIKSIKETSNSERITALENDIDAIRDVAYDEVIIDNGVLDLSEIK